MNKTPEELIREIIDGLNDCFTPNQAEAIFSAIFVIAANSDYLKDLFAMYHGVVKEEEQE